MAQRQIKRSEKRNGDATQVLLREVNAWKAENKCGDAEALREVARRRPDLWENHKNSGPTVEPGLRERFVMKAKARGYLVRIVALLDRWGSPEQRFTLGVQSSRVFTQRVVVIEDESGENVRAVMSRLAATAFRILETMARDKAVRNDDLDVLTEILDQQRDPIRLRLVPLDDPRPMYRRKTGIAVSFIDDLLSYMDLAARYGREHHACGLAGCASLMIAGRGGKKYCSAICRKAAWKYEQKKMYYLDKREARQTRLRHERGASSKAKTSKKTVRA